MFSYRNLLIIFYFSLFQNAGTSDSHPPAVREEQEDEEEDDEENLT